ncbi:MAG: hypothetical protein OEV92_07050 [Nitrospinota bacterium]|nr:hypothetical protein [Nitrospinota bacterium]
MKRTLTFLSIFAIAIGAILVTPEQSSAVPAFARQTGNACSACHFQFFPKLSAMGRAFKLGGYTDVSADLIEGDNLSTPATMPVSFITKFRYLMDTKKTAGNPKAGEERGVWEIPDEATFFIGGRLSSTIGYALEVADFGFGKGSVIFGIPTGSDMKAGVYVQASDGAGPANGMELMNTAIERPIRGFENRSAAFAFQKMNFGTAATGLGVYAGSEMYFVNVGLWGPVSFKPSGTTMDAGFDMALWYRVNVTPTLGGFDTAFGIFGSSGSVKCVDCGGEPAEGESKSVHEFKTDVFGADFQAQGEVGGMSLEVQAAYVAGGGKDVAWPTSSKSNAMNVSAFLGLTPNFGVKASYMAYKNDDDSKKDMNATNVGVWYNLAQNVHLAPEYAIYGGDGRGNNDTRLLVLLWIGY